MLDLRVLIAAAGTGSRSGLPYPKTLYPVLGRPILVRLIELLCTYDEVPVVIVSPVGRPKIAACLEEHHVAAQLVEQAAPTGMGDAILSFSQAEASHEARNLLVVWGDIPLLKRETVERLVDRHFAASNDFTFPTRVVEEAYTVVERDPSSRVRAVVETREMDRAPAPGERDIGLFIFRVRPVFELLEQRLSGAVGRRTGEHGFLYIIRHLAERGRKVEALPIATSEDLISLNCLSDLHQLESGSGD